MLSSNQSQTADIKPDNVLVNYGRGDTRFASIELADCGNTVRVDSAFANDRDIIGAPIWRSPEAQLQIGWGTPTDIWSLGAMASAFSTLPSGLFSCVMIITFRLRPAYNLNLGRQLVYL
jgi:serine/threonine protein kinase